MLTKELIPAIVPAPGELLADELEARGWTQRDFAQIVAMPYQAVNEIVNAKKEITPQTALKFAEAFGTSPELWLGLEQDYRLFLARARRSTPDSTVTRRSRLYELAPVGEMQKRGWLRTASDLDKLEREVCAFLGLNSVADTPRFEGANFRQSSAWTAETATQIAWLKRVEQLARAQHLPVFNHKKLEAAIPKILELTSTLEGVLEIPKVLQKLGIHFVIVPCLPHCYVDGAAFYLEDRPVVALSLRHAQLDRFWFTLLHEIAHILRKHPGVICDLLYGDAKVNVPDTKLAVYEDEANADARAWLLPKAKVKLFAARIAPYFSRVAVEEFAARVNRHPSIVVGRLQKEYELGWNKLTALQPKVRDLLEPWMDRAEAVLAIG